MKSRRCWTPPPGIWPTQNNRPEQKKQAPNRLGACFLIKYLLYFPDQREVP